MGNIMQGAVLVLEDQARRCLILAYQCKNKNAERILRLLAVDLMLEIEQYQRADFTAQFAALRHSGESARVREFA
jgi:hypothetical protein